MASPFSIVIPTYKEHDNIRPLIERLGQALAGREYEVLLVDDDSRDGTEELVAELASKYPVRIIVRKGKKGLSTAVLDGIDLARYDTVLVMDADLQHPPEVVPSVIQAMDNGADVAVASRYIPGGGNVGWSKTRQVMSQGGIFLAHLLIPLSRKVKDPMSGFFALRKSLIRSVKLEPIGYKILLEIVVIARPEKVVEVPFMFRIREKGESKLNTKQEMEYLQHMWSLMRRSGEVSRFIKFAIVGGTGVIVNEGIYWLLTRVAGLVGSLDLLAVLIAIEVSIITNFLLNNYFTFADRRPRTPGAFASHLIRFDLVSLIGAGIQLGVFFIFTRYLGFKPPYDTVALLIAIIIAMAWNFLSNNWWTWKR